MIKSVVDRRDEKKKKKKKSAITKNDNCNIQNNVKVIFKLIKICIEQKSFFTMIMQMDVTIYNNNNK